MAKKKPAGTQEEQPEIIEGVIDEPFDEPVDELVEEDAGQATGQRFGDLYNIYLERFGELSVDEFADAIVLLANEALTEFGRTAVAYDAFTEQFINQEAPLEAQKEAGLIMANKEKYEHSFAQLLEVLGMIKAKKSAAFLLMIAEIGLKNQIFSGTVFKASATGLANIGYLLSIDKDD